MAGQPREFGRVVIRGPLLLTIFFAGFWTIAFEGHKIVTSAKVSLRETFADVDVFKLSDGPQFLIRLSA
ncbi:MAG: hypothetical protein DRR08_32215 [Candidatus Parabeggiatoa sp. nov. 2]|nr:MAG: hypothetical protein B6247_24190 [Beggiatoa sp. 4572_84]RKZ47726.1 MAG: hypothetical protein DRR08_32215 [Gammaproteobacteria bacterium]